MRLTRPFSLTLSLFVICWSLAAHASAAEPLADRWLYLQINLQVADQVTRIEPVLERAAKSGYNGVVLADYKLNILDRVPEHYFANAARFRKLCADRKLEVIPAVCGFGYSSGILAHDPNLAEGLPAVDMPIVVREGRAISPDADQSKNHVAGDFEKRNGDQFGGWSYQDEPGAGTYADTQVKHGGECALRIENGAGQTGNRRVTKTLAVRPWTQFHASAWIRAERFASAADVRMFAIGANGRVLAHSNLNVRTDQDWTQHHVVFNTLDSREIRFYVGVWDCGAGKLWIDDVRLEEAPLVNLVRRASCPLRVTDEKGETTYDEGRDFLPLRDEQLGTTPWPGEFDVYHAPPKLRLTENSRIRDGQTLKASYWHAVTIYDNQAACSLTDPKVFEIVEDQIRRVNKTYQPRTWFLSHDEIRVANWSADERASGRSAGEQLAANVRRCVELVRKHSPESRLCVWNDMFDPHHNAKRDYYLVNGDLAGSWEGLPKDVTIVNWNSGLSAKSLPFFAERGHAQILAGYYDRPPQQIRSWLDVARRSGAPRGAMYTTWKSNFADLEKFAEHAWGGAAASQP